MEYSCDSCAYCGWEPDDDPFCMQNAVLKKAEANPTFGLYTRHSWKVCKGEFFKQHPLRVEPKKEKK